MIKSTKDILVISPFFYPEPISTGKFNTDMVLALRDLGHKVTVLCFHPFYPKWKPNKTIKSLEKINIIRGGARLFYSKNVIVRRIVLEFGFAFFVLRKFRKLQRGKDLIIPVFPPSLAFFFLLAFFNKKIRTVGIVHDLQDVYASSKGGFFRKILSFFIHKVERTSFQYCDQLIFLSEEIKESAKNSYQLDPKRLKVQYPFITIDIKNKTSDLDTLLTPDNKHVIYSGALGEKQNPIKLYELFSFCTQDMNDVQFHFFSDGFIFESLRVQNQNPNIHFHNLVPKNNIEELYRKSNLQIIPQKPGTSKGSLPSKLPNLLAINCPVLCLTDEGSEIDILFQKYNLETTLNTWEKNIFKQTVKTILNSKRTTFQNETFNSKNLFDIKLMINTILEQ